MDDINLSPSPQKKTFFENFSASALFIFDFLKVIIIALVIILPIRYFVFQPFVVSGKSMFPTYDNAEYLIIDEISYHFRDPVRGEVIVLRFPNDRKQFFIKRVIGLPGEKVQVDNGRVTIFNKEYPDGTVLDEDYLVSQGTTFPHTTTIVGGKKVIELKSDEYFMMGDNRMASSDSRDWGPLTRKDVIGKVFVRALPLAKFDKFQTPAYSFE